MSDSPKVSAFSEAARKPRQRSNPPPVTFRLTHEERERLLRDAGALSMAAYIRLKLFGEQEPSPHRKAYTRKKASPSAELVMLGHMLGGLGQSDIASNLAELAKAARIGALPVTPELEGELLAACKAVRDMRERLIVALGVKVR